MIDRSNSCDAGVPWLIGVLLALSLAVVVPIHLNHRFFPACGTVHAGLRATHHTVVDRISGRLEARIDGTGRAPAPENATVALAFTIAVPGVPRATSAPPQARMLRRLRIALDHADDGDPFSHTAFLRV
jgi:hypothetical protein